MSLGTPNTVEKLQTSLQAKAKTVPAYRFYSLWEKVCRKDVITESYRSCRANAGAAGMDGETFEQIEARGRERWLEELREELLAGTYASKPLLRVWNRRATEASDRSASRLSATVWSRWPWCW